MNKVPTAKFMLLEPLRGLAALWVFFYHYKFSQLWQDAFPWLHAICRHGELGVPMFFVISGFCIAAAAHSTVRKSLLTSHFLYRRLRRIYPPYWFSIAVVVALPFLIELISSFKTGRYQAPSRSESYLGFLNYDAFEWLQVVTLTYIFKPLPEIEVLSQKFNTINAVYWTLAIELQFYLIVALAIAVRPYHLIVLGGVTLLSIPFALTPSAYTTGLCLPYWPMFAIGVLVFYAFERGYRPSQCWSPRSSWISGMVVSLCVFTMLPFLLGTTPINMQLFACVMGIALYAAEGLDPPFQTLLHGKRSLLSLSCQLLMLVGTMSYTVYLLHAKLYALPSQFVRQVFPLDSISHDLCTIIITLVLCYPFYYFCERPYIGTRESAPSSP